MAGKLELRFYVFPDAKSLAEAAARVFITRIPEEDAGRPARVAISGGTTPKAMLGVLASEEMARFSDRWTRLELFWVDERCVGPEHADSNYRMTKEALLEWVPLAAARVHRMEGELRPEAAAERYEATIRNSFRLEGAQVPQFDLVMLGMGADGHTASIFPGTAAVEEMGRLAMANHVPQIDAWRLTLTAPVINRASEVIFLIEGAGKAAVLQEVLFGPRDVERLPSQLIRPSNGKLSFLLDEQAAAFVPREGAEELGRVWTKTIVVER